MTRSSQLIGGGGVPLGGAIKLSAAAKSLHVDGAAEYLRQGVYASLDPKYDQVRAAMPALDVYYQTNGYARSPGGTNNVTFLDCLALASGSTVNFIVQGDQTTRMFLKASFDNNVSNYWDMNGGIGNVGGYVYDGLVSPSGAYGLLGCAGGLAQVTYNAGGGNVGSVAGSYALAVKDDAVSGLVITSTYLASGSAIFHSIASTFSAPTTTSLGATTGLDNVSSIYHLGWLQAAGLWIAVGYKAQAADGSYDVTAFTSANGKDWTSRAVPAALRLSLPGPNAGTFPSSRGVSVGGAYIVAVNNAILRTTDGLSWGRVALPTGDLGVEQPPSAAFALSAVGGVVYARYIGATPQVAMGYYSTDAGLTWKTLPRLHSAKTGGTSGMLVGRIWSHSGKTYVLQKSATPELGPFDIYNFPVAPHLAATHFGEPVNNGFHMRIK